MYKYIVILRTYSQSAVMKGAQTAQQIQLGADVKQLQ